MTPHACFEITPTGSTILMRAGHTAGISTTEAPRIGVKTITALLPASGSPCARRWQANGAARSSRFARGISDSALLRLAAAWRANLPAGDE
jgi:hypothetical protein